ncbi:MAG: SUMF1/EgtB/PvdO family nonheme iron enzyme [Acidobacteria bacterium]|nr:SUMF1/EgtB/PvdO family nonheme iron enzyme [Acidobacteriota bacterium]
MSIPRFFRTFFFVGFMPFWSGLAGAQPAETAARFRISAVQDNQVWIEGGLIDGLEQGMEGEIGYEISVAGQKKRIIPAKVRLSSVEDRESVGVLYEMSGVINVGYSAQFVPKPLGELLLFFNNRASSAYTAKDFKLAQQYYQRILEILPGDAFATRQIKDCNEQLEKLNALLRERRNIPYYKEVIRASLKSDNPESVKLAQDYVGKILAIEPEDTETLKYRDKLAQWTARPGSPAPIVGGLPSQPKVPAAAPGPPSPSVRIAEAAAVREPEPAAPSSADTNPPEGLPLRLRNMVRIEAGLYSVGSIPGRSPFENELPRHQVSLGSFYIDRHEVTNDDYKKFCDATGHAYPEYFINKEYPPGFAKKPVVMVSWNDADAYARWAGKRLPTEFEWEVAAAGISGKTWPWGNRWNSGDANTREKGGNGTADVGSHPFDISEFGLFDMAGNVSEWTQNWYQPYPANKRKEKEYGEQFKVLRGGSSKASKEFARSQFRARLPAGFRSMDLGFRCALSSEDATDRKQAAH